ncbi:MAG: hypothetical protein JWR06_1343 [Jatrophihabitans sp.]|jgi:hypothetical protein|nr:hypothetical protein [Jatrophihabitans sp.]MDT4930778.1 hypothetical protein [Pseudonocardiales bacterium]MDT4948349.1 hypothetical protein [Pseudonocardiales bacterium]
MATLDRIEPAYTAWTPTASGIVGEDEEYVGRHRKPVGGRGFSLHRMFYRVKHRRT